MKTCRICGELLPNDMDICFKCEKLMFDSYLEAKELDTQFE